MVIPCAILRTVSTGIFIKATNAKKQMATAGGSVMLFCEVESNSPVTYEWFKDGTQLTHNGIEEYL